MATIKRHGTGWQVRIRRRGHPQQTKTFTHKAHAERWARDVEKAMDGGQFVAGVRESERTTLGEALDRRLHDGELDRLLLADGAPPWLPAIITLAVETAMRRSEIAGLNDGCIRGSVARLALTKNGEGRSVPLSPDALAAIQALRQIGGGTLKMPAAASMTRAFSDACDAAGIEDLRFHDLRHEATSRLFERGLSIAEVAQCTGHKTWAMLKRYTHPRAADLVKKLAARSGQKVFNREES